MQAVFNNILKKWNLYNLKILEMEYLFALFFLLCLSISIVKAGEPLSIAYTANINGNLEPCRCQPDELGSLLKLSGIIDSLRKEHPDMILLDNGDFLKTYPIPAANSLTWEFMNALSYDAIGVGDQEFVEGISFINRMQEDLPVSLVNTNITFPDPERKNVQKYVILEKGGYTIGITSVLPAEAFEFISPPELDISEVGQSLTHVLPDMVSRCDVMILLYHGSYQEARHITQRFPQFQLILAGHSQEQAVHEIPGKIIVQPGYDAEYLVFLTVEIHDQEISVQSSFLAVTDASIPRPFFKERLQHFHGRFNKEY